MEGNATVINDFKRKLTSNSKFILTTLVDNKKNITSESNISTIIEQIQTLENSEIKQNGKLSKFSEQRNNLESKLSNLESADTFLQEAHRMHTEKVLEIEKECKRMEQTFVQLYKEQRQEIDTKLKVDIGNLHIEKKKF